MHLPPYSSISLCILAALLCLQGCSPQHHSKDKIVYINSYHQGHPYSDQIMEGFIENMPSDSFAVHAFYMDTKRNPDPTFIENRASQLLDSIRHIEPDLLVVSDDNAVKYIVDPHIQALSMPIIFCGVNWTDSEYHLPPNKVTGILEILPLAEMLRTMRSYDPTIREVLVLSENTTTSRKEEQLLDTLYENAGVRATHQLVDDFEQWKAAFVEANQTYDIVYIPTHAAIKGWDHEEAIEVVSKHIQVPVVSCEDFMMPYAVFGLTKIAEEHGMWAAATAKKILQGSSPAEFPVSRNRQSNAWLNPRLAEKIGFQPDTTDRGYIRFPDF